MSSPCIHHRPMPTTLGLSLGFLGVVGLVVSLLSLVPINLYNVYLATSTLVSLIPMVTSSSPPSTSSLWAYFIFLVGSAVSSLITTSLVLATALVRRRSLLKEEEDMEANCTKKTTMAAAAGLWSSRLACLVIIGQISWAVFGTHLVWFVKLEDLAQITTSTILSVWILWVNYGVLILFSFVLFCASFFIILGTSNIMATANSEGSSLNDSNSSVGEMHQQETTPLLNKSPYRPN